MQTQLACLTPPGKAAIATLGVRGVQAWEITRQLFQPRKGTLPDEPVAGRFWFGRLGVEIGDEVILAVKEGLPCPALELHSHGGIAVVQMIQEAYEQQGATIVSWERFVARSEQENVGKAALDAAIVPLLARAPTPRTAAILLDQAHGAWGSLLEQPLDMQRLERLHELIPVGKHLVEPWRVALAGAVNVGKSSLMNALAGYSRSVVHATPGTTRDVVSTRLAIDGWPVEMIDTAGLRQGAEPLEQQGIERARAALQHADLRLWLLDASSEPILPDEPFDGLFVINKIDLAPVWDLRRVPGGCRVSAHRLAGLTELCAEISCRLAPNPPAPGEAVPCLPGQCDWVRRELAAREASNVLARQGV